ncbi:OmpH family outer membrane protein [Olleya sp. YS]|uniref:OmpH family outer membrane protein n=1 Tax=Olleya sp. YS TaxID=3028318 RepID=UPI0024340F9B|nr:OmpH family outer membrane protein [Olleya sp. YS]WGD35792.1 OmpH family outer membrane protein [Olleya sp. YS]
MKKLIGLILVALVLTSCQKQKIAYVDNGVLINEIKEKLDIEAKYTIKDSVFKRKVDSFRQVFQSEYQKVASLSKNKQESELQLLNQKAQGLQQAWQMEQQGFQKEYQVEIDTLISKVKKFVHNYGKTNGYDYILGTVDASPSVMYSKEENDISQQIKDAIDAAYSK